MIRTFGSNGKTINKSTAALRRRFSSSPSLLIVTCVSLLVSTVTFILSMLHLGLFSFWAVPIVFTLTLGYHSIFLVLEYFHKSHCDMEASDSTSTFTSISFSKPKPKQPTITAKHLPPGSTITSIVCACVLAICWSGNFALLLVVDILLATAPRGRAAVPVLGSVSIDPPLLTAVLSAQCVLSLVEGILLVTAVFFGMRQRALFLLAVKGQRARWRATALSFEAGAAATRWDGNKGEGEGGLKRPVLRDLVMPSNQSTVSSMATMVAVPSPVATVRGYYSVNGAPQMGVVPPRPPRPPRSPRRSSRWF